MKQELTFHVIIRSWCGVTLDKFITKAKTKADVEKEASKLASERGYYKATYEISHK